ncbi:hypothetical protein N018_21820 [Pseudomonas syringae CC1557]|uniref:Uncharacterized protein n=1 Tax=Pseudomonas syringae CC1557 TaxID=1357279 RepID=W0N307_PSESX|nr:hypothetical protein N018_21820 [Pseudomonas syringae CC1557]
MLPDAALLQTQNLTTFDFVLLLIIERNGEISVIPFK